MNIRNLANDGGVDRSGDRTKKSGTLPIVVIPAAVRDEASISAAGRATAAAVEGLAERARRDGRDREAVVASALQKLDSGALDGEAIARATAQRLLDAKFLSV